MKKKPAVPAEQNDAAREAPRKRRFVPGRVFNYPQKPRMGLVAGAVVVLGIALLVPAALIVISAVFQRGDPLTILAAFFVRPWTGAWFLGNTLDSIALLLVASLGAAVAFGGGCFNLGGEGQIYLGGVAASALLVTLPSGAGAGAALLLAAVSAAAAGGVIGAIPALMRKNLGANELISTFLFSAALMPVGDWLIAGPLRNPRGNLLATEAFWAKLPGLLPPSSLSVSFPLALIVVVFFHILRNRTAIGYRFFICGTAEDLARFGGLRAERRIVPALGLSGMFAGLTGFFAVAGTYDMGYQGFSGGLGWNAVAVALIAGTEPLALIPTAFFFGALKAGSDAALFTAGFNLETASFIQAAAMILAALPFGSRYLKGRLHFSPPSEGAPS
ncbi:MAG: ABC transporter permease [Treponema sp.]|jgi:simple sugar transport system permease protein|nr:ABC transporter permease [Treponema sp.]